MVGRLIAGVLMNFSLVMLILAVALALAFSRPWRTAGRSHLAEEMFRWVSLLAAGLVGLYTGVTHIAFPQTSAAEIGWANSPFQFEVGMADLTIGVLGLLAFRAGLGFRAAATIAVVIFFGGDAIGHVGQMITADNFAPGNAGSWFWTDILIPLLMVASLTTLYRQQRHRATPTIMPG
jgi:formate-dependent nitrite reductase membrane component NrfD